ncbi:Hsp70 family protein [Gracilibacillus kekensis]|nr:molecular chaperone HscC [Gracilibacillus kekensis]
MMMIGIDLGTSNSVVAYWKDGKVRIIPNALGNSLTPSIVSVDENNEIFVGEVAKERMITHPEKTASLFKRTMGTDKKIRLGSAEYISEELSSMILRKLKQDAEAFLKEEVKEAVISVPAYFNDRQRKATKRAAEIAGLHVERLISEPTAAALSYGIHDRESDVNFLVFDLGGGTYDVSILEKFDEIIQVRAIAGDNYLGGTDFTTAIFEHFLIKNEMQQNTLTDKEKSILFKLAEQAKYDLNAEGKTTITFQKGDKQYSNTIDNSIFEEMTYSLIQRLRAPIVRALHDASLRPDDLDAVILVGGATRMPLIKSVVTKILGRIPYSEIDPDKSVALGTAIQAALKQRDASIKETILTDVCPFTLGTDIVKDLGNQQFESGYFLPIIERNTPIPVSIEKRLYTVYDNQEKIVIDVYQGESRNTKDNLKIGEVTIAVPPAPAGEEMIDVRYTYDINGILEVECTQVSSGMKETIVIEQNPGNLSTEEIKNRLNELASLKIHPREKEENRLLIARGERLYEETLGNLRNEVASLLENFDRVIETQRVDYISKAAKQLKQRLDQIEGWNSRL